MSLPTLAQFIDSLPASCTVTARTGRAGVFDINWQPWAEHQLVVQRDRKGAVCGLTLADAEFAEFDPRSQLEGDVLVSEDYCLEIATAAPEAIAAPARPRL